MEGFSNFVDFLNGIAWGPWMLILLVGTGIFLSSRMGFIQFTRFGYAMKNTLGKVFKKQDAGHGEVTPFQAVTTALAATVGTGNIAGVTGAIAAGGPGAVFWMWVSALFGMATKYSEVVLAVNYRERNDKGDWVGGPMYYIKNGLGQSWAWLGAIFCVFGFLASFGIGNMTQVNTIASSINTAIDAFGGNVEANSVQMFGQTVPISSIIIGVIVAVIVALVLLGGIKRIGSVTEKLVPFMAVIYIADLYCSCPHRYHRQHRKPRHRVRHDLQGRLQRGRCPRRRYRHHDQDHHPEGCGPRRLLQRSRSRFRPDGPRGILRVGSGQAGSLRYL